MIIMVLLIVVRRVRKAFSRWILESIVISVYVTIRICSAASCTIGTIGARNRTCVLVVVVSIYCTRGSRGSGGFTYISCDYEDRS